MVLHHMMHITYYAHLNLHFVPMMIQPLVSLATPVAEILQRWHFTAALFFEYHMRCPICELATFETLEDALRIYNVDPQAFLSALNRMIFEHEALKGHSE